MFKTVHIAQAKRLWRVEQLFLVGLCFDDDASGGAKEEYLPRRGL
jgi:hypothetical protein